MQIETDLTVLNELASTLQRLQMEWNQKDSLKLNQNSDSKLEMKAARKPSRQDFISTAHRALTPLKGHTQSYYRSARKYGNK